MRNLNLFDGLGGGTGAPAEFRGRSVSGEEPIVGGGGGSGGSGGGFAWDSSKGSVKAGYVIVGRYCLKVAGKSFGKGVSGMVWLKVTLKEGETPAEVEIVKGSEEGNRESENNVSYIPLYKLDEGKVDADFRGAPTIQCWE